MDLNALQNKDCEISLDRTKRTFITIAAIHLEKSKNYLTQVSCKCGTPIAGHVYDAKHDAYLFFCVDYLFLGFVDAAAIYKSSEYVIRVPLSISVVDHLVESSYKKKIEDFKASFDQQYRFHYLQMIDVNDIATI